MMNKKRVVSFLTVGLVSLLACTKGYSRGMAYADVEEPELNQAEVLVSTELDSVSDSYLEGYIQALLDLHYCDYTVEVVVRKHTVYLSNLPKNELVANSIVSFVQKLKGVERVEIKEKAPIKETVLRSQYAQPPRVEGVWFPQSTVLFPPLVADSRQVIHSVSYRGGDGVMGNTCIAVSIGDEFPIFRWKNMWKWQGDLQISIDGGIWALFNFDVPRNSNGDMCELMNTDYLLGIPLTYAVDRWAFRLRAYHISGHLGDEFLVNHPSILPKRKNPSFEALDFFTSYQFSSRLRAYAGPGWIFHSDKSFKLKPLYVQWGAEARVLGHKSDYHKLYGTPFFAVHLENWQQHHWNLDSTLKLGYEWSKLQGIGRKMRVYLDYHRGFSYEGQFFNFRTNYGGVGFSWGF